MNHKQSPKQNRKNRSRKSASNHLAVDHMSILRRRANTADTVSEVVHIIKEISGTKTVAVAIDGYEEEFNVSSSGEIGFLQNVGEAEFQELLTVALQTSGVIVIRQHTGEMQTVAVVNGHSAVVPVVNLYGIALANWNWYKVSANDFRKLAPEPGAIYCELPTGRRFAL